MRVSMKITIVFLGLVAALLATPGVSLADDAVAITATEDISTVDAEMGVVTVFGPKISAAGPPTALKVQAQFWHVLVESLAFHASTAVAFSGETTFRSNDPRIDDANYDSTVSGEFAVGVKWFVPLDWPVATWLRGALEVEVTGGEELIGYSFGPTVAAGVGYDLADGLSLVGETELGTGYGQYKGSGSAFAFTVDILIGAQIAF